MKIMFVCLGNICRSPMAEFIFKNMLKKEGLDNKIFVSSAATSNEEFGNPVYPPARRELARHGISCEGKTAVKLKKDDYSIYDMFICMDSGNVRNSTYIFGGDPQNKIKKLLEFVGESNDIFDPWYTNEFDVAYNDIYRGCEALLAFIKQRHFK